MFVDKIIGFLVSITERKRSKLSRNLINKMINVIHRDFIFFFFLYFPRFPLDGAVKTHSHEIRSSRPRSGAGDEFAASTIYGFHVGTWCLERVLLPAKVNKKRDRENEDHVCAHHGHFFNGYEG